jgi:hypothetical protein
MNFISTSIKYKEIHENNIIKFKTEKMGFLYVIINIPSIIAITENKSKKPSKNPLNLSESINIKNLKARLFKNNLVKLKKGC